MMNIKGGTKTWAEPGNTTPMRGDNRQIMSATQKENVLGDQDLGSFLNKVADPNYVDPEKTRRVGNNSLDKDAFMKLFLAQLKNQDPSSPLESHELAAQLAQFSSIEKLDSINTGIGSLARAQNPAKSFDALAMIGRQVEGDSSKVIRTDNKDTHDIRFNLMGDAAKGTLSIRNDQGLEIRKMEVSGLKKGDNKVEWNGNLENGSPAPVGDYTVVIEANNSAGQKVFAQTAFKGKVTGLNFTAEGPVLLMGKTTVRMSDIKQISDSTIDANGDNKINQIINTNVKDLKAEHGDGGGKVAGMGGNLENVGMSSDLIEKLGKEVIEKQELQDKRKEEKL